MRQYSICAEIMLNLAGKRAHFQRNRCSTSPVLPLNFGGIRRRLFKAYGFNCYCIFDGDAKTTQNDVLFNGLISNEQWVVAPDAYVVKYDYAYFGIDFETYFRASMPEYGKKEKEAIEVYGITSKPGKAKAVAQHCDTVPEFIIKLKNELVMVEFLG